MQHAILESLNPAPACASVTTAQMASITALTVTSGGAVVQLRAGDFTDLPNLEALDLRDNGIRVLPERLLDGVPAALSRFDIRGNPVTRIPVQVLVDWDDPTDPDQALFIDEEDRLAGFQYRVNGTMLSRLVLIEDDQATARNFNFQVVLPDGIPRLSENTFVPYLPALNPLTPHRLTPPLQILGTVTVHNRSISWTPDGDFAEEVIAPRTLLWVWSENSVYLSEGVRWSLAVEEFPVEVRETLVLRDANAQPNRIEVGSTGTVAGWMPQAVPSASAEVAAGLDYEYALVSNAGGLFAISTANGVLSPASGQLHTPGIHEVVVMVTATGAHLALAATAQAVIEVIAGVDICARTEAVRTAILAATPETADDNRCNLVRPSQLAAIRELTVTSGGNSVQLQAGDFADMPNLQALDLRNNGIRDLPANILDDIPPRRNGGFYRLDIRNNPMTRIPPQIVAYMDTVENGRGTDGGQFSNYLLIDEEDRFPGLEYAPETGQATTLSRLVLHEGQTSRFRVFPPAGVAAAHFIQSFDLEDSVLHQGAGWTITATSIHNRELQTNLFSLRGGMSTLTVAVSLDDNFAREKRPLRWRYRGARVDGYLRVDGDGPGEATQFGLFTEDFPLEVHETFVLGDANPAPNRIAAGAPSGSPVIDWQPQPMPSASSTVAAGLDYAYTLASDADGLFAINTASGVLSVAPGRSLPAMPSSHHLTVMAAVDGPDFTLTATAPVTVEAGDSVFSICDRSARVRAAILASMGSGFTHCGSIDRALLGAVSALTVTSGGGTVQFRSGDFHDMPGLRTLDLSGNGLRDLPKDLLDGVGGGLIRLDISANPATRVPAQILAALDAGVEQNTLLMDEEDRLAAFHYTQDDGQATTLTKVVLHEGGGDRRFRISLPDDITLPDSRLWEFAPHDGELGSHIAVAWQRDSLVNLFFTEQDKTDVVTMSATQNDDFIEETRRLVWSVRGINTRFMTASGRDINLFTGALPVEVRETLALRDEDPSPNRVAPGTPAGLPVAGWRPRAVPSAGSTVTAALDYEYELTSNPDGLFAINTANGVLSLAPAGALPAAPSTHDAIVMVTAAGPHLALTATAALSVVQDTGFWYLCDRTPAVQRAILAAKGGDNCALVAKPLTFGALMVTGSVAALQRGDFRGVSVTASPGFLFLRSLGLQSLSPDVFEGAGVIRFLDISRNHLRDLPADVFSHLPVGLCETHLYRNPLTRLPIRLLTGLKRIAPTAAVPVCGGEQAAGKARLVVEGDYGAGPAHAPTPDYLGNIRFIDANTGAVVSPGLVLTEGKRYRIQVELDALPGVSGRFVLNDNQRDTDPLALEPTNLAFTSFAETTRIEVTVTAKADDNREHGTVFLSWLDISGTRYYEGTRSTAEIIANGYDGDGQGFGVNLRQWRLRTPPLPVRILEPVGIADTNPEPNRIWKGVPPGTGVAGWAPQTLVDGAALPGAVYSLVSDAGLFAIDTVSGALSASGGWPLPASRRRDIIVGTDYEGAPATRTVAIEVFDALSLEDADVAQNTATVGQTEGEAVRGIRPVVRADGAVVADRIAWALTGGGGLFRADTSSGAILLTRRLTMADIGVWTVTQTALYAGAEASLPLPVVVSVPGRVNICDRTPAVQAAILTATPADDACGSVSLAAMAELTRLRVTTDGAVAALSNLDFQQLPRLNNLQLDRLGLTSLPAAIFRSSAALEVLFLQDNSMAVLPVQLLADLGHLSYLQVDGQVRVGGLHYRVDGEVTTGTLVISEDASRDVLVEAVGGLHTTVTLTFQGQGAPVAATPVEIAIGPFAAARRVRLSAVADADIVHNKSPVSWRWDMVTAVQRGMDEHIPTPGLALRVNETVALTDTAAAGSWLREDAADDVAVAGWSPLVTAGGVAVPTTAVSYRLAADAGGLFEADSATGALSLADGRALDYAVSSRHTVIVEADYDGVAAVHSVVIDVLDVTDICSRTDAVESAILEATTADDVCESVLVSELEAIAALTVTAAAVFVTEADFAGLLNLADLDLIGAGAVRLPVQFVAGFGRDASVARLRVDRRARISGLIYRDDEGGEVITPPLVLAEGASRTLRVATSGVFSRTLRFSLDDSGLRGVTATESFELGLLSTPTLVLAALTDEDFDPVTGVLVWVLEPPGNLQVQAPAGAGFALHHPPTEGLRVDVREADVFQDANPAANHISETAAVNTAVSGWSPQVLVNGVTTTAVRYSLEDDAGGLFGINSATGALLLAAALDYETSTFHVVEVAARVSDTGATALLAAVVHVDNVVEQVVLRATPNVHQIKEGASSGTRVGVMLVAKTEDGVTRTDGVMYALTGSASFRITTSGDIRVLGTLDYEETSSHALRLTATYEGVTSAETLVIVNVEDLSLSLPGTAAGVIAENAAPDTAVTGVEISALFGESMVTTAAAWALSGTGAETFRITTDTGVARLRLSNAELDYGTTPAYTLSLRASWLGETTSVPVVVEVADVNSLFIELTGTSPHIVTETAPFGARVGDARLTAHTEDDERARTSEVDWHISPDTGLFDIATGAVIVAGVLDYETSTLHTLTITASWQSAVSNEERLVILIADVERDPQLVDLNSAPNTVLNTTNARVAGLSLAFLTDGVEQTNNVKWIFATATPARTRTAFTINTATGVIRLNNPITATLPQPYEATVTATQTDRTASLPLSIRVVSGLSVRIRVFFEGAVIP